MKVYSLILVLFVILSACTNEREVNVQLEGSFPLVAISNPFGADLKIKPLSDSVGSIGYERNNKVFWLEGKPEISDADGRRVLNWKQSEENISLQFLAKETDFDISLTTSSDAKPSKWFLNIATTSDEYFTGIFERVVDGVQSESWKPGLQTALNLRGEKMDVHLLPTVSAYAPFYISSAHYGFYAKGTWPGSLDFCKSDSQMVQISWEGPSLDFTLYRASTPATIVKKHALESGPSIVPPQWAIGMWRWRDENRNLAKYYDGTKVNAPYNSTIVEDVLMMEAYGIPFSAYWIDRPWGTGRRGYDDFLVDSVRLPEFERMIKWLNGKDKQLMLWIAPWVIGNIATEAIQKGYALKSKVWEDSTQVLIDFTNTEAVKWWQEVGPAKLARMGVRGIKLDRADGEMLIDSLHLVAANRKSYRENYNDYPRQYVKATYDAMHPILGDDMILFPRAQYDGSARYGGMWAGDTRGSEWGLRSAIIGMQRCAVMGYPLWGSDTGGYWGEFSRETAMRWLGFSCFSPFMEVGPTWDEGFWNSHDQPAYDTELIATWRMYAIVRTKLSDYIHSLAVEANETGMPIARPLFLSYPDQPESWNDWQTFTLGNDILVSAIWQKGTTTQSLYLPKGETWVSVWEETKEFEGGSYVDVDAPMHQIPIFVRKGSAINLGDLNALYIESLKIARTKPNLKELEAKEIW